MSFFYIAILAPIRYSYLFAIPLSLKFFASLDRETLYLRKSLKNAKDESK